MGFLEFFGMFAILVGLNILDLATTYVALGLGASEKNPIAVLILDKVGFNGLIWLKVLAVNYILIMGLVVVPWGPQIVWAIVVANIVYLVVILNNFLVIRKRRRPHLIRIKRSKVYEFEDPLLPI